MSAKGVKWAIFTYMNSKEFRNEVNDNGKTALSGFNLTDAEKSKFVFAAKNKIDMRDGLPSRITKGTGGVRAWF